MNLSKLIRYPLLATSLLFVSAQVSAITVGGITFNDGLHIEQANIVETALVPTDPTDSTSVVGQTIEGYGIVTAVNGYDSGSFCASGDCQLTYAFSGYEVISATIVGASMLVDFTGGVVNFFVEEMAAGTKAILAAADFDPADFIDGTPWLNLIGTDSLGGTSLVVGTLHSILDTFGGPLADTGDGDGFLNVDLTGAGIANSIFDTDGHVVPGFGTADFLLSSSFQPDQLLGLDLSGTAEITGGAAVPEPGILALLGLGVLLLVARGKRESLAF